MSNGDPDEDDDWGGPKIKSGPQPHVAENDVLRLTSQIVASFVSKNSVPASELPALIRAVSDAVSRVMSLEGGRKTLHPAVPIKKSVTPDFIICLEDGKKLKMLRRHLKTAYDMSPEEYRQRWGLPSNYPMVAPNYARQRSKLAKSIGLGAMARRRR